MKASDFMGFKRWVVAGDVLNQEKYAHKIFEGLKSKGFQVSGVNPKEVNDKVFKSIKDVDYEIEVLDLCINPKRGLILLKEVAEIGVKNVLIQPGAESDEILKFCEDNKINGIEGCALVELKKI